jgi:hypothetical protein
VARDLNRAIDIEALQKGATGNNSHNQHNTSD